MRSPLHGPVPPLSSVHGLTVLITGAGSGMGALFARRAAREGAARVVLWDRDEAAVREQARLLEADGARVTVRLVDLAAADQIAEAAGELLARGMVPEVLVHNAGIVTGAPFVAHTPEQIRATMAVNATAPMLTTAALLPALLERGRSGRILTMASAAGLLSNPDMSVYAASKAAVLSWADSLRLELERDGARVGVTTVCPSYISTGMFDGVRAPLLTPIMRPEDVVERAWDAMLRGTPILTLPASVKLSRILRGVLPTRAWDAVAERLGVYRSMSTFTGRAPR